MKFFPLLFVLLALSLAGCSKKKEEPVVKIEETPVPAKPQGPQAGIEFFDGAKQQRYEEYFKEFCGVFETPQRGSAQWLRLAGGQRIGGTVESATDEQIMFLLEDGPRRVMIGEIAQASRERLFAADFARVHALARLNGDLRAPAPRGVADAATRYAMTDGIVARVGPGFEFKRVPGEHATRGQPVAIREEFAGWLRLDDLGGQPRWIPKCLTYPLDEAADPALKSDADALVKSGLLVAVRCDAYEADVDPAMWRGTDSRIRMGIARSLAAHCAATRTSSTMIITIRDSATQKRLGKYSQSQGWKEGAF